MIQVVKHISSPSEETENLYLQVDDMDSKKKKAFELILAVSKSAKISLEAVEAMQEFVKVYADIIEKFDQDYKEIYKSRLDDAIEHSLSNINALAELQRKMEVLGE